MITVLSPNEKLVAQEFCKGLADKEVAGNLGKSVWTIRTQKRTIYKKLGISKDTELLWYMICDRLKRNFDLKELRKHGLELLFSVLFIVMQVTCHEKLICEGYGCREGHAQRCDVSVLEENVLIQILAYDVQCE